MRGRRTLVRWWCCPPACRTSAAVSHKFVRGRECGAHQSTSSWMLSVFTDTTVTGGYVSSVLSRLRETGGHLRSSGGRDETRSRAARKGIGRLMEKVVVVKQARQSLLPHSGDVTTRRGTALTLKNGKRRRSSPRPGEIRVAVGGPQGKINSTSSKPHLSSSPSSTRHRQLTPADFPCNPAQDVAFQRGESIFRFVWSIRLAYSPRDCAGVRRRRVAHMMRFIVTETFTTSILNEVLCFNS